MSKKEEDTLQNLSKRDDIIISKADKRGTVVIVAVHHCVQEANRQLDNKEFYKFLTRDATEINQIKVNRTINELKSSHLLVEKIANDLLSSEAKTPQFIFHQMIALQRLRKMFFISSKKLFSFSRYSSFCTSVFPSFSPCKPLL